MSARGGLPARSRRPLSARPLAGHATLIDRVAAVALTLGALWAVAGLPTDRTVPVTAVSAVACTSAVAWRRARPALAALVALTAVAGYQVSGHDTQGAFVSIALLLTCYSAGRTDPVSRRQLSGVAAYGLVACTLIEIDVGFSVASDLLAWVPLVVVPLGAGLFVQHLERTANGLREVESQLRDERETARARATAEERTRVARELHDVVAHCVTVMVIQAGAARLVAGSDAAAARAALSVVVSSGRGALADLRRVVGVQRQDEPGPACGLSQLERLVDQVRDGGLDVRLQIDAELRLPDELDLSVYRIVQEALTNVCKHAPSATAEIYVGLDKGVVEVRVEDSGPATPSSRVGGSGQGLLGMRERVALHDGELRAQPTRCGGFVVYARLPLVPLVGKTPAPEVATREPRTDRARRLSALQVDALFSAAWLVALEVEAVASSHRSGPLAMNVAVLGVVGAAGVIRRRAPFVFLAIVGASALWLTGGIASPERASLVGTYTLIVCAYTIAAYRSQLAAVGGLVVMLAAVITTIVVLRHAPVGNAFGAGLLACGVWIGGRVVRRQRTLTNELSAATARLAAERDNRALLALYDERARIARDLHALVARLVTTMVIQAEVAEDLLDTDPDNAVGTISVIEQTGRHALTEMRHILGVLRNNPVPLRSTREQVEFAPALVATVPS